MSVTTFEDEQILEETGPGILTSIGHVGIVLSSVSFLILPILFYFRSQYIITNERVMVKNKALSSDSTEMRIEDIQQLDTYSNAIFGGGIRVTVGAGSSVQIPFKNPNNASTTIRQLVRDEE
jgi:uncharacterized membrane protein YdbT with pleckstrin-like domain